ncbi:hypothetical protein MAPG_04161 [Magnaporthiopsis poae ATCC 64411]|uniref:Uncharacterized protein n=1 Tax=Magnaporthiopsis poae (strain ATCC 64411 / 73-15) TaxID=644358 RepID=A0A0C4DVZ3_MAGP6|nr:hypothetical protein MAPG_04161 [Magnaporthiopsis poae ATCC 64411]
MSGQGNVEAEFHARRPGTNKPLETSGHAMGTQVGKSGVPEFHAETHPPGTAPPSKTYQPAPDSDPSVLRKANNLADPLGMPGATSQSVHNATEHGMTEPGQTTRKLRGPHDDRTGLEGEAGGSEGNEGKERQQQG